MELDRDLDGLLERLDELVSVIGSEQSGHILDADRIGAHLLELLCVLGVVLGGVDRSGGVANRRLNVTFLFLGRVDSGLEVSGIVERVEDTQDVDAVGYRLLDKVLDDVVGVMTVAEDILSAEEHLKFGVLESVTEFTKSVPRVFF